MTGIGYMYSAVGVGVLITLALRTPVSGKMGLLCRVYHVAWLRPGAILGFDP